MWTHKQTHTHTHTHKHTHTNTHTKCVINYIHTHIPAKYCIMQSFGRGKPWWIWQIIGGLPNFTVQILTMSRDINKESKQTGICQSFIGQKFLMENLPKFSSTKKSCYTAHYVNAHLIFPSSSVMSSSSLLGSCIGLWNLICVIYMYICN